MHQLEVDHEITYWYLMTTFLSSNSEGETNPEEQAALEYHTVASWMRDHVPFKNNEQWCGTLGFTPTLTRGMLRCPDADVVYVSNGEANLTNMNANVLSPLMKADADKIEKTLDGYYVSQTHRLRRQRKSQSP